MLLLRIKAPIRIWHISSQPSAFSTLSRKVLFLQDHSWFHHHFRNSKLLFTTSSSLILQNFPKMMSIVYIILITSSSLEIFVLWNSLLPSDNLKFWKFFCNRSWTGLRCYWPSCSEQAIPSHLPFSPWLFHSFDIRYQGLVLWERMGRGWRSYCLLWLWWRFFKWVNVWRMKMFLGKSWIWLGSNLLQFRPSVRFRY